MTRIGLLAMTAMTRRAIVRSAVSGRRGLALRCDDVASLSLLDIALLLGFSEQIRPPARVQTLGRVDAGGVADTGSAAATSRKAASAASR
jgi:hypothetical protein